jgi:hypothetical protein
MKLIAGALMLLGAEQAYAHAKLIQFPHQDAATVLLPAAVIFLALGTLLVVWGLLTEWRSASIVSAG